MLLILLKKTSDSPRSSLDIITAEVEGICLNFEGTLEPTCKKATKRSNNGGKQSKGHCMPLNRHHAYFSPWKLSLQWTPLM